jgi:superfamily II DNA/RNA helicase
MGDGALQQVLIYSLEHQIQLIDSILQQHIHENTTKDFRCIVFCNGRSQVSFLYRLFLKSGYQNLLELHKGKGKSIEEILRRFANEPNLILISTDLSQGKPCTTNFVP